MVMFAEPRMVTRAEDCQFYHTMDLPELGVVQGPWDLRENFDEYVGGVELKGKTVLDVGTASGFLTFEAEKRGAQVVSFEIADATSQNVLPFKDNLHYKDYEEWVADQTRSYEPMKNSYWLAHRLYRSKAKLYYGNIYRLPESLGKFDVVFAGSVIEHLSDPISALSSISKVTGDIMVLNTTMLDSEERIAKLLASADDPAHDYTWWIYSRGLYEEVFAMLGFHIEKVQWSSFATNTNGTRQPRAAIVAVRTKEAPGSGNRLVARTAADRSNRLPNGDRARPSTGSGVLSELDTARARLAALESLGPVTLEMARRWRRLADTYPRAVSAAKCIAQSLLRLPNLKWKP